MKQVIAFLVLLALVRPGIAATEKAVGRTIGEIDIIPNSVLQRSISPKFYKSLLISPIRGWVVVRGSLSGTRLTGLRIIHSEPNNLNDSLALQRAGEVMMAGNYAIEHPGVPSPILVHLLLYKTADGVAALSFAHLDNAGGNQMQYYGCAHLAVLKDNGQWVEIKGPESLEGKGVAVRQGAKNNLEQAMKLETFQHGAEATIMSGH